MSNGLQFPLEGSPQYGSAYGVRLLHPDDGYLRDDSVIPDLQSDIGAVGFWVRSVGGSGETFDMSIFATSGGEDGETPRLEFQVARDFGSDVIRIEVDNGQSGGARKIELYPQDLDPRIDIFNGDWHFIVFQPGSDTPRVVYPSPSTDWYEIWLDGGPVSKLNPTDTGNDFYGWFASVQKLAGTGFDALGLGTSIRTSGNINFYEGCLDELFVFDYRLTAAQINAIYNERLFVSEIASDPRFNYNNADPSRSGTPVNSWSFDLENTIKPIGHDSMGGLRDRLITEGGNQNTGNPDRDTARMDAAPESHQDPVPELLPDIESGRTTAPSTGGYSGDFRQSNTDVMLSRTFQDSVSARKQWPQVAPSDLEQGAFSFWIRKRDNDSQCIILNVSDNLFSADRFYLYSASGGIGQFRLYYRAAGGSTVQTNFTDVNLGDGLWHHIVLNSFGAGSPYQCYFDGVLTATTGTGQWLDVLINASTVLGIGSSISTYTAFYLDGWLDNVCYHKNPLTATEVAILYNNGRNFPIQRLPYSALSLERNLGNNIVHCYTFDKAVDQMGNDITGGHDFDLLNFPVDHSCEGIRGAPDIAFDADPLLLDVLPLEGNNVSLSITVNDIAFDTDPITLDLSPGIATLNLAATFDAQPIDIVLAPAEAVLELDTDFAVDPVTIELSPTDASLQLDVSFSTTPLDVVVQPGQATLFDVSDFDANPVTIDLTPTTAVVIVDTTFTAEPVELVAAPGQASLSVTTTFSADPVTVDITPSTAELVLADQFSADPIDCSILPTTATLIVDTSFNTQPVDLSILPGTSDVAVDDEIQVQPVTVDVVPTTASLIVDTAFTTLPVSLDVLPADASLAPGTTFSAEPSVVDVVPTLAELNTGQTVFSTEPVVVDFLPGESELFSGELCYCPRVLLPPLRAPVSLPLEAFPITIDFEVGEATLLFGTDFTANPVTVDILPGQAALYLDTHFVTEPTTVDVDPTIASLIFGTAFTTEPISIDLLPGDAELTAITNIEFDPQPLIVDIEPGKASLSVGSDMVADPVLIDVVPTDASLQSDSDFLVSPVVVDILPTSASLFTAVDFLAPPIDLDVVPTPVDFLHVGTVFDVLPVVIDILPSSADLSVGGLLFPAEPISIDVVPTAAVLATDSNFLAPPVIIEIVPTEAFSGLGVAFTAPPVIIEIVPTPSLLSLETDFAAPPVIIEIVPTPSQLLEIDTTFTAAPLIVEIVLGTSTLSTSEDPVFVYCVPDRLCTGRVVSRDILVMQEAEEFWVAFEFYPWLEISGNTIKSIKSLSSDSGFVLEREHIADTSVIFRITVPPSQEEADFGIEVAVIDSADNELRIDGILRIRDGLASL